MPVQTVQSAARRVRRLDRLNNGVEFVLDQMRAGASLRCTHGATTCWMLSTGFEVSKHVADLITKRTDIAGAGDGLFGAELSQTFRHIGS